jgi:glycerophosphoryl diester phosphodiesterase
MAVWTSTREVAAGALHDLLGSLRSLTLTDLAYKAVAFALLTPATTLLLYGLRSTASSTGVVADVDLLRFFVTTPAGVTSLLGGGSLIAGITALEIACLMAIGLAAAVRGVELAATSALRFASARSPNVLRLTAHMVLRLLAGLAPFLLAAGLVYALLLREYDINYYLARRPPVFLVAAALVALLAVLLVALLVWTVARWALALPLVLFENVSPRRALGESARRSAGSRSVIVAALLGWALAALVLLAVSTSVPALVGRSLAPRFAGSLLPLLLFFGLLVVLWVALGLAVGVANISLFALLIVRLYLRVGEPPEPALSAVSPRRGEPRLLSGRARALVAAVSLLAFVGIALSAFLAARRERAVAVIAHRGSSAAAPENTLAAFRLAAEQGTDYVELDVQESADGEVLVVHDSDLMKVGGDPRKIWEADAAALRSVDVGSHTGAQFSSERVPTLAEALAVCRGRCRVIVELKSYGHDQLLEDRVVEIVERAGMERDCIFMSLDHDMVRAMKRLRPSWRCGVLVAKAIGDLTSLHADFLAVEARMATARFVRRAHRAGQDVYVWTVNDPAWMLTGLSRGVDGLITDHPDLARQVVERRDRMSDAQRLLVALLVRLGASTETLAAEDALRP